MEEKVYDTEELKHLWKTDNLKFPYDEKSNFSQNLKKIDPERNKTILAKNKEAIKPKIIKKGGKLEEEKEATTIENETLPEKWERTSDFEELKKQFIENLKKFRGNSIFQNEQIELINKKPIEVLNNQIKFMEEELKKETEAEKKIEWQKKINKIKKIKKGLLEKNKEKKDKVKIETEKKIKTLKQLSQLWKKRRKKKKKRRK